MRAGVVTKGIDPLREERSDEALRRMVAGNLDFTPEKLRMKFDALVIGKQLSGEWKLGSGAITSRRRARRGDSDPPLE